MNITPKHAEFFEKLCALCDEYKCEMWPRRENKQNHIVFEFGSPENDTVSFNSSGLYFGSMTVAETPASKTFQIEKKDEKKPS